MKLALASVLSVFGLAFSPMAHADLIMKAALNVTCTPSHDARAYRILSTKQGTIVMLNGAKIFEGPQLTGGTEGAEPYLQAIGPTFNITISGGEFEKAFLTRKSVTGDAPAVIFDSASGKSVPGTCRGTFSFEPLRN